MNRILAVGTPYLKGSPPVVRRVGAVACSALFALVWSPDVRAQERPAPAAQNQDLAQPSSRQQSEWLQPVPKAGAPIRVTERSGKSTTGRFASVHPSGIQLMSDGVTLEVPLADIALVRRNGDS